MGNCLVTKLKAAVDNPNLPIMTVIGPEVRAIMTHYSSDPDETKAYYLQQFFDTIGSTLKGKLSKMLLPLFAANTAEAIYDIIQGSSFIPVGGSNKASLNTENNRARITENGTAWPDYSYQTKETSEYGGCAAIMISNFDGDDMPSLFGCDVGLNKAAIGELIPRTNNNTKIIGAGVVSVDGTLNLMRLGDNANADRLTECTTKPWWFNMHSRPFSQEIVSDASLGTRILVVVDQLLTSEEAQLLRDAVVSLDSKFYSE